MLTRSCCYVVRPPRLRTGCFTPFLVNPPAPEHPLDWHKAPVGNFAQAFANC